MIVRTFKLGRGREVVHSTDLDTESRIHASVVIGGHEFDLFEERGELHVRLVDGAVIWTRSQSGNEVVLRIGAP